MNEQKNQALAELTKLTPEGAALIFQSIQKEDRNPYAFEPSFIKTWVSTAFPLEGKEEKLFNAAELIKTTFQDYPPTTQKEKECWVDFCKTAAFQGGVLAHGFGNTTQNQNTFIALWQIAKNWMTTDEQLEVAAEVFLKNYPSWSKAAAAIAQEATCDWNQCIPTSFDKLHRNSMSFNPQKYPVTYLCRNKEVLENLIQQGADLSLSFEGVELYKSIQKRPLDSFDSSNDRRQIQNLIIKQYDNQWTQQKAWETIRHSKQISDVERLLIDTKKDWPEWRGALGETMAQYMALFRPDYVHKLFKRKECPTHFIDERDSDGRDFKTWLGLGIVCRGTPIDKLKLEDLVIIENPLQDNSKYQRTMEWCAAALELSLHPHWMEKQITFTQYRHEKQVGEYFFSTNGFNLYFNVTKNSWQSNNPKMEEDIEQYCLRNIADNTPFGQRFISNFLKKIISNNQSLIPLVHKEKFRIKMRDYILKNDNQIIENQPNLISKDTIDEYICHYIIQELVQNPQNMPQNKLLRRVDRFIPDESLQTHLNTNVNPHEVLGQYSSQVKKIIEQTDWHQKIASPWERLNLIQRSIIQTTQNKPLTAL